MYNEEKKKTYISNNTNKLPAKYLETHFKQTEGFEIQFNKDVADFTKEEILTMYTSLKYKVVESLRMFNSQLSIYTRWFKHTKDDQYALISFEMLLNCIDKSEKRIISKNEVDSCLKCLINPVDKFFVLGLFEGIKGEFYGDFTYAKISDFFGSPGHYKVKLYSDRTIDISDDLYEIAQESSQKYEYIGDTKTVTLTDRVREDGLIVKERTNAKNVSDAQRGRRIGNRMARFRDRLGLPSSMGANQIYESGKIFYINSNCIARGISATDFFNLKDCRKKYFDRYGITYMNIASYLAKNADYLV